MTRRVKVVWQDSRVPTAHWQWRSEMSSPRIVEITTLGFLIKKTKRLVVIAHSISRKDLDGDFQMIGMMEIPRRSVISIERI